MPSESGRRFDVGQIVMARWPKSSLYFTGEILDFNDKEYLVRFDDPDKSELAIRYKDVTIPFRNRSRSRSLGRTPTKGVSKSPSRRKSPSRKSPHRKSPGRKSPGRSPSRRSQGRSSPQKSKEDSTLIKDELTRTSLRERYENRESAERKLKQSDSSPEVRNRSQGTVTAVTSTVTSGRQSTRIPAFEKKIAYSETKTNSISSSNSIKVDATTIVKKLENKNRVVELLKRLVIGVWMTLKCLPLAFLLLGLPFVLLLLCTSKKCEIQIPEIPRKFQQYYDQRAVAVGAGVTLFTLVLSIIPIGRTYKTKSGARVRCNGYLTLLGIIIGFGVLAYMKYNLVPIYLLLRQFCVFFTALGILISVALYIKSFFVRRDSLNPEGKTGYYVVDFLEGREICPRIWSFDVKFFIFRLAMVLNICLCVLIFAKELHVKSGQFSLTLLASVAMKVVYALLFIVFEESYLTTYEYNNVGTGAMVCIGYSIFPVAFTMDTRYILNHGYEIPLYCLVSIVVLYVAGVVMLFGANLQKHTFRKNPADPSVAHLESLPTSSGKRLLVSGWWGMVRHPNYLGDVIVQLCMAMICGFTHAIPWVFPVCSVLYLLGRIIVVEKACKNKYGLAWSNYIARVPHRLIPKVF